MKGVDGVINVIIGGILIGVGLKVMFKALDIERKQKRQELKKTEES